MGSWLSGRFYKKRGMAIVFAVLLVSLVLAAGLLLLNINLRQLVLSLTARDSRYAFYAADSALNCARYWEWDRYYTIEDQRPKPFWYFLYNNGQYELRDPTVSQLTCAGSRVGVSSRMDQGVGVSEFRLYFPTGFTDRTTRSCARVTVTKWLDGGQPRTVITSFGYTLSDQGVNTCPVMSDRTVERAIVSQ